jgi:hypothetical protein
VITVICSLALQAWMILEGRPLGEQAATVFLLMWIPGLASIATRLFRREGFFDVSFRLGGRSGRSVLLLAWVYPIPIGFAAYGVAWMFTLTPFSAPPPAVFGIDLGSNTANFVFTLVQSLVILTPLMLTGQYVHSKTPLLAVGVFLVGIIATAFLLGWMHLHTGSIWPAVVGHASWKAIIQGVFDRSTTRPAPWVGEGGVLTAVAIVSFTITVLYVARKRQQVDSVECFT